MPQMKPMMWFMIFIYSMFNLMLMMIMINFIPLKMKFKNKLMIFKLNKKWNWLW